MEYNPPWLRFYDGMSPHLDYPQKTMWQLVADAAAQWPKHTAYEFMGRRTRYAALPGRIARVARALCRQGVRPGDRVAICMPNCPQAVDALYACNRLGAVAVMIHPLAAPMEIAACLRNCRLVLTLDRLLERVGSAAVAQQPEPVVVAASLADELPLWAAAVARRPHRQRGSFLRWRAFLRAGENQPLPDCPTGPSDAAVMLFSGGTTGESKGVLLSNRNLNALALQTIEASGCKPLAGMKMLAAMPLFHGFGLGIGVHTPLVAGAACILVPRFTPEGYARLLRTRRPDFVPGVPTLFEAMTRSKQLERADLRFLRGVFCGGDTLPPPLRQKINAFLAARGCTVQIREGYGTTECVTASCLTPVAYHREGSIGIPFPDTWYTITSPGTTSVLPVGEEGEICLRGPTVMMGYADAPEATAQALRRHVDGFLWLHTGDLGRMDADGFVYFSQRIKRMIITSGYNVYPSQIEACLDAHPKLRASCVVGVPDAYRMQRVRAYVVPRAGVEAGESLRKELLDWCAARLARYALPRELVFCTELPRTAVGKINYRLLEDAAYGGAGHQ